MHTSVCEQKGAVENRVSEWGSFNPFPTVLLLFTCIGSLCFILQVPRFLHVTADNVYPEAAGVLSAYRWAHGLPLYEDYQKAPYLVTAFPPVWYAVMASGARVGFNTLDSLTFFGRLISLASLVGLVGLGYYWNRRLGLPVFLALLTPTFYLSFPILIPWAVAARPDLVELLCAFIGLSVAAFRRDSVSIAIAASFCSAAFLIRHNAVAAPIAIVLWLSWLRRWQQAALFCIAWAAIVSTMLIIFQRISHGLLLLNLSGAKFGHFGITYARDVLLRMLTGPGAGYVTLLVAVGLFSLMCFPKGLQGQLGLLRVYLVVSLGLAVVGSAAGGAAVNHYMQPIFAIAVLVPSAVNQLRTDWAPTSAASAFLVALALVLLFPAADEARWEVMHNRPDDMRPILPILHDHKVFTDIPYLSARTSAPQLLDLASLAYASRSGGWNGGSAVARDLWNKKYDLLVLSATVEAISPQSGSYPRYPHITNAISAAIEHSYSLCFQSGSAYVYGRNGNQSGSMANCPVLVH